MGNGAKERVAVIYVSCEGDLKAVPSLLRERSESNAHLPSVLLWGALLSRASCVTGKK